MSFRPSSCLLCFSFPSNSSKTFEPLEPLKTCPAYAGFCFTTLQTLLFHFSQKIFLCYFVFSVDYQYTSIAPMFKCVSSFTQCFAECRMSTSTLTTRNSPSNRLFVSSFVFRANNYSFCCQKFCLANAILVSVGSSVRCYYGTQIFVLCYLFKSCSIHCDFSSSFLQITMTFVFSHIVSQS